MNSDFEFCNPGESSAAASLLCSLSLAGLLTLASIVTAVLLLFPVRNGPLVVLVSKAGFSGTAHGFPKGQLQADARTLGATLQWLVQSDANVPPQTAGA